MKKAIFFMAAFAAAFLAGCSSESENGGGMDIESPSKFKATFESPKANASENAYQEYAYLGKDDYCYWEKSDEVSIFTNTNKNCQFKSLKENVKITELSFTEVAVQPTTQININDYFAIYPYSANNTVDADGKLYSSLPASQAYNPAKLDLGNAIMVSRIPSTNDVFEFKNSCALIKFYIKKYSAATKAVKVKSISVISKANNLAGDVYVETAGSDYTAKIATTGTPSKTVTLTNCEAAGELSHEDYTVFLLTIPAGTYAAKDLTVTIDTDVDDLDYTVTLPKKYVLARSKYVELKTMLGSNSLDITDDVESVDKAIMCDTARIAAQGFVGSESIEYDYEIPNGNFVLNGNGKTYNFKMTSEKVYIINTFTTHQSGYSGVTPPKVTVNDLNITGELRTTTIGVYVKHKSPTNQAQFNTEWNNINILNNKIVPYAQSIEDGGTAEISMASAVCVYGTAVLNNCNIYGAEYSEKAKEIGQWTEAPLYDMACTNSTNVTINGGKVGSIYCWEQSKITAQQGANIDYIYSTMISTSDLGKLTINDATVGEISISPNTSYNPYLVISAEAKIDTLEFIDNASDATTLFDASYWSKVTIADGATIGKIIVGGEEIADLATLKANYSLK